MELIKITKYKKPETKSPILLNMQLLFYALTVLHFLMRLSFSWLKGMLTSKGEDNSRKIVRFCENSPSCSLVVQAVHNHGSQSSKIGGHY
jgi:hypothetical protein